MKIVRTMAAVVISSISLVTFAATLAPADKADLDLYLKSEILERKIPGMQVAVVQGDKIVLLKSYGNADLAHSIPVKPETVFSINSATKSFTGVAAMQLSEQGKLDLNAPLSRYLNGLPLPWQTVTITQLLNHTSGLPDIVRLQTWRVAGSNNWDAAWDAIQKIPMDFSPGERFRYNQTNYLLLGKIIDQLAGMPFERFIHQQQFDIANMNKTGYGDTQEVIPHRAPPYRLDSDGKASQLMTDDLPRFLRTGGGINSTAGDLAQWIIALNKDKLLSRAGKERLWKQTLLNNGQPAPWALGWPIIRNTDYRAVAGIGGARSAFYIYPEKDLAVVILTNLAGAAPEQMIDAVASYFLPELRKINGTFTSYLLRQRAETKGYSRLDDELAALRKNSGNAPPSEDELNAWGYRLLQAKRTEPAVAVFTLATRLYSSSSNAHDSLAEAYEANGQLELSIQHYRRSLELNSKNTHATERLRALSTH